jgi:hypothetical protein
MLGVVIGTYSDYYCIIVGIFGTLFGVIHAAYKAVVSNHLMTGRIALSVSEILLRILQSQCYNGFSIILWPGSITTL